MSVCMREGLFETFETRRRQISESRRLMVALNGEKEETLWSSHQSPVTSPLHSQICYNI